MWIVIVIVIKVMVFLKFSKWGFLEVDLYIMSLSEFGIFCGGDIVGVVNIIVESVNDGK